MFRVKSQWDRGLISSTYLGNEDSHRGHSSKYYTFKPNDKNGLYSHAQIDKDEDGKAIFVFKFVRGGTGNGSDYSTWINTKAEANLEGNKFTGVTFEPWGGFGEGMAVVKTGEPWVDNINFWWQNIHIRRPFGESSYETARYEGSGKIKINWKAVFEVNFRANNIPEMEVNQNDQSINTRGNAVIKGKVKDIDGDTLIVSATLNGIRKTQTIGNTNKGNNFSLTWNASELKENEYTNITLEVNDGLEVTSDIYKGKIMVDKTPPKLELSIQ